MVPRLTRTESTTANALFLDRIREVAHRAEGRVLVPQLLRIEDSIELLGHAQLTVAYDFPD
jgi:hypothetical protein